LFQNISKLWIKGKKQKIYPQNCGKKVKKNSNYPHFLWKKVTSND